MKTFKLVSLDILEEKKEDLTQRRIKLHDGLIINREDDKGHWVIEAYVERAYDEYFQTIFENEEELMIQVKITKSSNRPATFLVKVIDTNIIGDHMNVIFMGNIVDRRREHIEKVLKILMDEGFQGDELLEEFKRRGDKQRE
ncbi:YwpF-like family protein [Halobacillus shinanisalinarum]|uniref:YwpF-like family protein n=1 Tax=Halobacillus shinanisalinarum TaxID=2932258 RepID=A0ABY4H1Z2_9BACI|nr:YwpF-like family protein [Halobacillus shinanisalinarum]UOQ92992.1 YwpF-like family protein [Halobacillus shinanisalinarum]